MTDSDWGGGVRLLSKSPQNHSRALGTATAASSSRIRLVNNSQNSHFYVQCKLIELRSPGEISS